MPAPPSVQVKCAVTGLLFQPFAFGAGLNATVMVGDARSILMEPLVDVAVFPARSVAVPEIVCVPSVVTTASAGQPWIPDPPSAQVKCTVTGPVNHPCGFGDGLSDAAIVGT